MGGELEMRQRTPELPQHLEWAKQGLPADLRF
jgi:hypothetical protein